MNREFETALIIFAQEAEQLLSDMENALLSLETDPGDNETINRLFRAMHTIKGSSGLFGFSPIVGFTHLAESVLDKVRNGEQQINEDLISVLLDCKDHTGRLIEHCLANPEEALPENLAATGETLIQRLTNGSAIDCQRFPQENSTLQSEGGGEISIDDSWLISLKFGLDAFRNGIDPLPFIQYLKTMGEIKEILTMAPAMPSGEAMDPENCYLHFNIAFNSDASKQAIEAVFEFAENDCEIHILPPNTKVDEYISLLDSKNEDEVQLLGEMLMRVGALTPKDVKRALALQTQTGLEPTGKNINRPLGEILVEQQVVQEPVVEQALKKQEQVKRKLATDANYIRIDAAKLGQLINLVGELVISNAALVTIIERHDLSEAEDVVATMTNLINSIRDTSLEIRMVQIGETFSRFRRVVRDVSNELGKQIELIISGGETELDKTVVEKINDPLTHLVRNALDHGIESPEQRLAAGKLAHGTVHLNAYHESGHIVIQIADDGAGLDCDKIVAKAVANGLIKQDHGLSQTEVFNLIFAAGLSTKEQATSLSGRGVGMDVVKKNIEAMHGTVSIDSELGQGTTMTIQLPLTLAIIDGFMVSAEQERFIIPLNMVAECVEMEAMAEHDSHYINLRGQVLPYVRLRDYFNCRPSGESTRHESMVVVKFGKHKAGLVVDRLHGELQTVIKPLGKIFEQLQGISGATVLGDGNVALILDVQSLIQQFIQNSPHTQTKHLMSS